MRNASISRRGFVIGSAGLAVASLMSPAIVRGQSKSVLRYRVFTDMQVLDPPFRLTAPEGDA